jgi:hypothetical protein
MTIKFTPPDRYEGVEYTFALGGNDGPVINYEGSDHRYRVKRILITEWAGYHLTVRIWGWRLRKDGEYDRRGGARWVSNDRFKAVVARVFLKQCRRIDLAKSALIVSDDAPGPV